VKHITLAAAMDRVDLTQQRLEDLSGVDRTWISKLKADADANPTIDTYEKLDSALRTLGALRRGEKLVFGQPESVAS
jgi:transcriptional regulator with XRE-family HTH domain